MPTPQPLNETEIREIQQTVSNAAAASMRPKSAVSLLSFVDGLTAQVGAAINSRPGNQARLNEGERQALQEAFYKAVNQHAQESASIQEAAQPLIGQINEMIDRRVQDQGIAGSVRPRRMIELPPGEASEEIGKIRKRPSQLQNVKQQLTALIRISRQQKAGGAKDNELRVNFTTTVRMIFRRQDVRMDAAAVSRLEPAFLEILDPAHKADEVTEKTATLAQQVNDLIEQSRSKGQGGPGGRL